MKIYPWDKLRVYNAKPLNTWTAEREDGREETVQVEYFYREYDNAGELCATGSEDFSPARAARISIGFVHTWDGKSYRKDMTRRWEYRGVVRYSGKKRILIRHEEKLFPEAAIVEVRGLW